MCQIEFPSLTVVVPIYNKAYILERCLRSIEFQAHKPNEVILIDDGSLDNSYKIALDFKSRNPDLKCHIERQENSGVSVARNKGVELSSNEYICFLDADDEWKPFFLDLMTDLLVDFPDALLFCLGHEVSKADGIVKIPKHGCFPGFRGYVDNFFKASVKGSVAKSSKVCVRKSAFLKIGGFPPGVVAGEDLYVWAMLALKGKVACHSRVAVTVNQLEDESRHARKVSIPYPVIYFGDNRRLISDNKHLKRYVSIILLKHMASSISCKNYKEAVIRWWAFRKISVPMFLLFSVVFIFPFSKIKRYF